MVRTTLVAALVLLSGPALADDAIPFEKVANWEIERAAPGGPCLMSKIYKDPDDDNAENAFALLLRDDKLVVSFSYEHWTWAKNEKIRAPLVLDKVVAIPKSVWIGNGVNMRSELPDSLVPNLLAAKKLVLKLDGADADFDLAGFPQAYASLRRCHSAPKPATAAASPAPGSDVAAGTSTPSAHIARAMTFPDDGDVPPRSVFPRDTPKILAALEVRDVKPGDTLKAVWIAEKTSASSTPLTITAVTITLGSSPFVSASLGKPDAGWPPGQYRIDLSHNDGPIEFSQRFSIKE